jgi:hypothetical protein
LQSRTSSRHPKRQTDVTAVVKKQLSSGETTYKVDYNRLGLKKDPAFGIRKQLRVTYIQGHITKTATTYDGLVMDFNPKPVVFTDAKGDKIVIVKGTYGDLAHPARCIDVTSALIDSASKPKGFPIAKFDRNYVGNEDPAVFFVKSARIDYTVNGKHATKTIKEGDRLDF